jgi:hypothetical protein
MGTRNLTIVIHEEKPVIAQYGQWDGYPSGNGIKILNFLRSTSIDRFKEKLKNIRFTTTEDEDEIQNFMKSIGSENGWVNSEQSAKFDKKYPYLTRDIGCDILNLVYKSKSEMLMSNHINFAGDSLFCEWAYVINLDKNVLEVYTGFNKRPLGKTQRFKYLEKDMKSDNEYYPIRMVKKYKLSELPTNEQFLKDLKNK